MYDPLVGRFLEEDPKGFAAGDPNLFRYVHNSPTNATDPSGMQTTIFYTIGVDGWKEEPAASFGGGVIEVANGPKGQVTVRTGVKVTATTRNPDTQTVYDNSIEISYWGTKADKISFVQFGALWLKMTLADKDKKETTEHCKENVLIAAGRVPTSVGKGPTVFLDADSTKLGNPAQSPGYVESGGTGLIGGPDVATLWDSPDVEGMAKNYGQIYSAKHPNLISMQATFQGDTYIVYDKKPIYRVSWEVTSTWTPNGGSTRKTYKVYPQTSGKVEQLPYPVYYQTIQGLFPNQILITIPQKPK